MRRTLTPILATGLLLGSLSLAQAQMPRLAIFTLQCFVPTTRGYHTRASLVGQVILATRTVWFMADCTDGPSPASWPEFQWADGAVQELDLWVTATLEDAAYQLVRATTCTITTGDGFYTGRCMADESLEGQVNLLVSIAAPAP
jgi:hypothetical protein